MKKYTKKDIVIAVLIVLLPFLYYSFKFVPEDIEIWEISIFRFGHGGFDDVQFFIWNICVKGFLFMLLTIWFITSKHWWRHAILVSLIIEFLKLLSLFRSELKVIDEIDFIYSLPVTIPLILFLIFLSKKMGFYSRSIGVNKEINDEIDIVFKELMKNKNSEMMMLKQNLLDLKRQKTTLTEGDYLEKLIRLKKQSLQL